MKTAILFSAGGLYGAYQAGVWRELHGRIRTDIVVGASIGALNAWAVAGGCTPEELEQQWLSLTAMSRLRWRVPRSPLKGFLDFRRIEGTIRELYERYTPGVDFGVVVTDTLRMRPRLFRSPEVTWRHLAASVGIIAVFEQYRIGGRVYSDGGLLGALPLWAPAEMGAKRIIAVNALPAMPSALVRTGVKALRSAVRYRPPRIAADIVVHEIRPERALGSVRESLVWTEDNARRWMDMGRADARKWLERGQ